MSFIISIMIGFLPSWIWPVLAGMGIGTWFLFGMLSKIPGVSSYSRVIKPAAIAVTVFGIFMYGGTSVAEIYQERIQEMEKRVAAAEQHSTDVTELVQTKSEQQIKFIRKTRIVYKNRIKEVEKLVDAECKIDKTALDILNNAAINSLKAP